MQTLTPIAPFSDLRSRSKQILALLKDSPVVLTLRGRPSAVLIDYDTYNQMVEKQHALESARDALLLQRATESATGYHSFADLLQQHETLHGDSLTLTTEK